MRKLVQKINKNAIIRNLVLAICLFIIFIFMLSLLLNLFTRHNEYIKVPLFEGLSFTEASALAESNSLVLEINDSVHVKGMAGGSVIDQYPKSDREVKAGRHIFLVVNSYNKTTVKVPYVTGYSLRQAKNNLQVAGLEIAELIYRDDIATNNILEQQYRGTVIDKESDLMVELGSGVTLIVGRGATDRLSIVPNVLGLSLSQAKSRLWEVGLNIGGTKFDSGVGNESINSAKVFVQSPDASAKEELGGVVTLELTLDQAKVKSGIDEAAKRLKTTIRIEQERRAKIDSLNAQSINLE